MSKILPYEVSGNKYSNKILVFLHGWPDTTQIWDKIIPEFEEEYYVLNISYPNYSQKEKSSTGNDFEEMASRIKTTIDSLNDTKRKIVMVSHDWGASFGYYVDHLYPKYISEMIVLDVGAKYNIYKPIILFYQFTLVIAFIIGGFIGKKLTHGIMKLFKYSPEWAERVDSSWNYPYFYRWRRIFKCYGNLKKAILPGYVPSCNVTFVYGKKKPAQFFNKAWTDLLAKNPQNEVVAADCGHWIQRDQPQLVISLIQKRLK